MTTTKLILEVILFFIFAVGLKVVDDKTDSNTWSMALYSGVYVLMSEIIVGLL